MGNSVGNYTRSEMHLIPRPLEFTPFVGDLVNDYELPINADELYLFAKSSVIMAFPPLSVKCRRTKVVRKVVGDCGISS